MDPGSWDEAPCTDLRVRALVVPYALGLLTAEERDSFEVHVLECDVCYENLRSIERTSGLLREFLDSRPVEHLKRLRKLKGRLFSLRRILGR